MRKLLLLAVTGFFFAACKPGAKTENKSMVSLKPLLNSYYEERMRLFPIEASTNGDDRYNDRLPIDISESYRDTLRAFYRHMLDTLHNTHRADLDEEDKISFDILQWDMETAIAGMKFSDYLAPINQFWSLPLTMGQLGSGKSIQPFRTVRDYENFLVRIDAFTVWCDTAINNMRRGIAQGYVLPKVLMERMLPQFDAMVVSDVTKSIFYDPIRNIPDSISKEEASKMAARYTDAIRDKIVPTYNKLAKFVREEYLPHGRETAGIGALPGGKEYYQYLIRYWTTTDMTADQVFELGQSEVNRIMAEMQRVKDEAGFKGDMKSFFTFLNTDPRFFPFHSPAEVLAAYEKIHQVIEPHLSAMFNKVPRTRFEIRETEKFREASASAEYNQGTPDGKRPGIFYVPIPDARKFNTFAMEDLFLHEAIPGHHYQMSLQQENDSLPEFRRFTWYGAYGEGWALYTESLGKELGLYKDVYQYFGALSEEMHRALRLVIDVGMHAKGWTREQAIEYSLEHEGESRESITAEVERYMAIPGQALSYKIGQLKIRELRSRAEQELGSHFSLARFHDAVLESGCLPISVLESRIDEWIRREKKSGS